MRSLVESPLFIINGINDPPKSNSVCNGLTCNIQKTKVFHDTYCTFETNSNYTFINYIIDNTVQNERNQFAETCANCNCCYRHQINRPSSSDYNYRPIEN